MSAGQKTQVKTMIDDLNDVLFTSQQYFNDNFTSYFDQANLIDFMLFVELIHDWDHLSRDIQIVSYDMKKVYFLPWDKDTTFGVKSENELISPSSNLLSLNSHNVSQTPFYRIYTYDPSAVEARYAQLRETGIFSAENIYHLIEQCSRMISPEMWKKEYAKWSRIGDGDERHGIFEQSSFQMIDWTEQRVAHLDTKYNYAA